MFWAMKKAELVYELYKLSDEEIGIIENKQ